MRHGSGWILNKLWWQLPTNWHFQRYIDIVQNGNRIYEFWCTVVRLLKGIGSDSIIKAKINLLLSQTFHVHPCSPITNRLYITAIIFMTYSCHRRHRYAPYCSKTISMVVKGIIWRCVLVRKIRVCDKTYIKLLRKILMLTWCMRFAIQSTVAAYMTHYTPLYFAGINSELKALPRSVQKCCWMLPTHPKKTMIVTIIVKIIIIMMMMIIITTKIITK